MKGLTRYLGVIAADLPRLRPIVASLIGASIMLAGCTGPAQSASESAPERAGKEPVDMPRPNPLRNVYFGDLHLHTRNSFDAYIFNVRATPEDAYAYAKGGSIKHSLGLDLKMRSGPLDFLAVTDHAEYLGVLPAIDTPGTSYSRIPYAGDLFSTDPAQIRAAFAKFLDSVALGQRMPELSDLSATRSAWQETIRSAERNYRPGRFTTFIAYEFTSMPDARNLHRNVIFENGQELAMPFSALDSRNPEDLWRWLDRQRAAGTEALAIPHNGNASDGTMFERTMWNGKPIDRTYAELRRRNEPLAEISQVKGQSETMPLLSPNDEFAGFEVMPFYIGSAKPLTKFRGGYVRDALKSGLEIKRRVGVNPYQLGMVAGSDSHNAAGPFEEWNYNGKVGALDGTPQGRGSIPPPQYKSWDEFYAAGGKLQPIPTWGSAGLTGVWAEENTRASIYAALRRKETFGTTGPRIRVRMFAGFGLKGIDLTRDAGIRAAYSRGVPMGGEISARRGQIPEFLVVAEQDVHSAPLQRIQIVKGWIDSSGRTFEKIFDVACSDGGVVDRARNRCPDNGATVDLSNCAVSAGKGDAQLRGYWKDPEFDPRQNAFYYARILENPTCRWSTWDAVRANVAPNPKLPATIQERAYSSPVWFVPVDEA